MNRVEGWRGEVRGRMQQRRLSRDSTLRHADETNEDGPVGVSVCACCPPRRTPPKRAALGKGFSRHVPPLFFFPLFRWGIDARSENGSALSCWVHTRSFLILIWTLHSTDSERIDKLSCCLCGWLCKAHRSNLAARYSDTAKSQHFRGSECVGTHRVPTAFCVLCSLFFLLGCLSILWLAGGLPGTLLTLSCVTTLQKPITIGKLGLCVPIVLQQSLHKCLTLF